MVPNLAKKISISTLMLASTIVPLGLSGNTAFADTDQFDIPASVTNSDGTPAWSVNEMIAVNQKLEAERKAKCGNDAVCRDQLYIEQQSRSGIGHALLGYNNKYFLITAVYPEQNKTKVVFHGDDQWLKAIGFNYGTPIEELIVSWFDEGIKAYNNGEWADAIARGEPWEGSHVLYAKNIYGGFGWEEEPVEYEEFSFPTDEEFEITTDNPEDFLINNTTRKIHFRAFGYARNNIINNADSYDYSTCYNSPDYSPEVGCHLFYDENYRFFYLPYEVLPTEFHYTYINSDENTESSTADPNNDSTSTGSISDSGTNTEQNLTSELDPNTDSSTGSETNSSTGSATSSDSSSTISPSSSSDTSGASTTPNTGEVTANQDYSTEFPWWLGVIFATSIAAIIWFIWPIHKKSAKK